MDAVRQGLGTGGLYSFEPVGEHRTKNLYDLSVAAGLTLQLALHAPQGDRQIPFLERRAVAKGAGFARQNWDVVQGIVDRVVAPERSRMPTDNLAVLPEFQPVGVSPDLDRSPDGPRIDRVPVLVEPHEAGLGHRRRHRVEAIERADIGDQAGTLGLKHLPDRLVRDIRVLVRLGRGDAAVFEPCVQFSIGFELRSRHEEPPPDHADLVLDLPLLPARRRGAGNRIDEIVPAHLLESAVVGTLFADKDRVHRGLHIIVDAPRTGTAEEGEGLVVRIEYHLLRLAGIGPDEGHSAKAQPDMSDFDRRRHAVEDHDLMAPVELVCFAGIEAQRNIGVGRRFPRRLRPSGRIPPDSIIAAAIAAIAELLVNPDDGQTVPLWPPGILGQHLIQIGTPGIDLRAGLRCAVIGELRLARADDLAHRIPGQTQLPANPLDRLAVDEMQTPDLRYRLQNQHPPTAPSCL